MTGMILARGIASHDDIKNILGKQQEILIV